MMTDEEPIYSNDGLSVHDKLRDLETEVSILKTERHQLKEQVALLLKVVEATIELWALLPFDSGEDVYLLAKRLENMTDDALQKLK